MKLIYSRAAETYAWLGRDEVDGFAAAMAFSRCELVSEDGTDIFDRSHRRYWPS